MKYVSYAYQIRMVLFFFATSLRQNVLIFETSMKIIRYRNPLNSLWWPETANEQESGGVKSKYKYFNNVLICTSSQLCNLVNLSTFLLYCDSGCNYSRCWNTASNQRCSNWPLWPSSRSAHTGLMTVAPSRYAPLISYEDIHETLVSLWYYWGNTCQHKSFYFDWFMLEATVDKYNDIWNSELFYRQLSETLNHLDLKSTS